MSTKLRKRETLGFRPQNEDQEKFILDAFTAAGGGKMSDFLRRCVLIGAPTIVEESRNQRDAAFAQFEQTLRETGHPYAQVKHPKRKAG